MPNCQNLILYLRIVFENLSGWKAKAGKKGSLIKAKISSVVSLQNS